MLSDQTIRELTKVGMTKFIRFEDRGKLVAILEIGIGEWPFDEKTLRGRIENLQRSCDDVSVEQTALADMMHRKWGALMLHPVAQEMQSDRPIPECLESRCGSVGRMD